MLNSGNTERTQDQNQKKLGPGQMAFLAFHGEQYPFIEEFSEFLANVSTQALKTQLMTRQQRLLAKAIWEAENYGGSEAKCKENLKERYGHRWYQVTTIDEHMAPERDYCIYVLLLEHQRQWQLYHKKCKLHQKQ